MKRVAYSIAIIFILVLSITSCTTKGADTKTNTNTPGKKSEIDIQSSMTLSNTEFTFNGQLAYLRLKMVKGRYYEDWNPGAYMGTNWEGQFVIDLADEFGKTIAETDICKAFSEPLIFNSSFNIDFDDYNDDGDLDFTIGQYGSNNGYLYKIFTLRKDGKVEELPIKDHPDLFISNRTANYSTKLHKINGTTFEIEYYDNSVSATFHDFYQWDGKEFVLSKSQKMTQEDAVAGSLQDKNTEYTYVKYGKSEDGLMQFTRNGTKIKGYVEMASINDSNEVKIKKYPFTGTLVDNYISITFPEESWRYTRKGASWIGRFDDLCFDISLPVDTTIDPNGYTILTFNKGAMNDFNNDVTELKGRAKEWKREANANSQGVQPGDVTFDDQKQVEQLIRNYFSDLEKKDYANAWELTSQQQKNAYPRDEAINEHWGIESLKFISMKGYLPTATATTDEVPLNTPTVWFVATFDVKPSPNTAWGAGITSRYVDVRKDSDGKWRIDGLATGR